jgi:hypothetical protein
LTTENSSPAPGSRQYLQCESHKLDLLINALIGALGGIL